MSQSAKAPREPENLREFVVHHSGELLAVAIAVLVVATLVGRLFDHPLALATLGTIAIVYQLAQTRFQNRKHTGLGGYVTYGLTLTCVWGGYWASIDAKGIDCSSPIGVVIKAGEVTIPRAGCYAIDTEDAARTDYLERVNCDKGVRFDLIQAHPERVVTIKRNLPHINLPAAFSLNAPGDLHQLGCRQENRVYQVNRSSS